MESKSLKPRTIMLCTDDITPSHLDKFWKYWVQLKAKIPLLKLNAFVIPHYCKLDNERITRLRFKHWFKEHSNWVSLHLHGFDHSFPPENTRNFYLQEALIKLGKTMLAEVLGHENFGYKAPGYYLNEETRRILKEENFLFICHQNSVEFLVQPKQSKNALIVQSHTNGISVDSVEKIYRQLEENFKHDEFITFDELYR